MPDHDQADAGATAADKRIWSGIEAVITSTTGNRVTVKSRPRVRIPPTPPKNRRMHFRILLFFRHRHLCGRDSKRATATPAHTVRWTVCEPAGESLPLRHQRNLFCLPQQKRFFLAFWAKNGQNTVKSGFGAVDQPLRSPIFCVQAPETGNNAGVLFAFLCSVKKEQKGVGGRT